MIHVILPTYLQRLAKVGREINVEIAGEVTFAQLIDVLETTYPMLQGTIRDHQTKDRREYLRFFACGTDFSHQPMDSLLPEAVSEGKEPFRIVGAMSGG